MDVDQTDQNYEDERIDDLSFSASAQNTPLNRRRNIDTPNTRTPIFPTLFASALNTPLRLPHDGGFRYTFSFMAFIIISYFSY